MECPSQMRFLCYALGSPERNGNKYLNVMLWICDGTALVHSHSAFMVPFDQISHPPMQILDSIHERVGTNTKLLEYL